MASDSQASGTELCNQGSLNDLSCNTNSASSCGIGLLKISDLQCRLKNNITALPDWDWQNELRSIASNENGRCYMCSGYYGSNHSQPICTTCHIFLFPVPNLHDDDPSTVQRPQLQAKDESEDSGNEEPLDLDDDPSESFLSHQAIQPLFSRGCPSAGLTDLNITSPMPSSSLDNLRQRVRELSEYNGNASSQQLGSSVQDLPPEVLLQVFAYLSDMELYTASNVCNKWYELIESEVSNIEWEEHVKRRWPLFKPHFKVDSWKDIHSQLVSSAPCLYCIENMKLMDTPPICEQSWRHRRLTSELKSLQNDPPEGILAAPLDKKCSFWQAVITGPKGSPYESGNFYLYLQIPHSYPLKPPLVKFITKIFHPNVSRHGDIGLDSIHHNWSLALTISKILLSIQSLLTDPYLKVCMEPAIARCYQDDIRLYNSMARRWTWKYAMSERQQVFFGVIDENEGFVPFSNHSL